MTYNGGPRFYNIVKHEEPGTGFWPSIPCDTQEQNWGFKGHNLNSEELSPTCQNEGLVRVFKMNLLWVMYRLWGNV